MLDWRILAASFIALVFVSFMLSGSINIRDLAGNLINKVNNLFGTPLTNPFSSQKQQALEITVSIFPSEFTINPSSAVNITTGSLKLYSFDGDINVDLETDEITLTESRTNLVLSIPAGNTTVSGLEFDKLRLENMKLDVRAGEWSTKTDNGSIEVSGFIGKALITGDSIEFTGKASEFTKL